MQTDKLVPYKPATLPVIPGGEATFLKDELRKIANALKSLDVILSQVELSPVMPTKAGAVVLADVAAGQYKVIWDTTNSTVGLYANMGGTLKSVMLT